MAFHNLSYDISPFKAVIILQEIEESNSQYPVIILEWLDNILHDDNFLKRILHG